LACLYYDHLVTFPQEVEEFWKRKISFVSILFFVNRYATALGYIPIIYFIFWSPGNDEVNVEIPIVSHADLTSRRLCNINFKVTFELTSTVFSSYKVAWILSVVFDTTIFALTLIRTIQMRRVY
ncbi:hypothetical protein SCHPADRAFT_814660, partial [Schizopora paradoxa]